jgi:hypothetical protein
MATCQCKSVKHQNHLGRPCENEAAQDEYCKACAAAIAIEAQPELPPLPPRT